MLFNTFIKLCNHNHYLTQNIFISPKRNTISTGSHLLPSPPCPPPQFTTSLSYAALHHTTETVLLSGLLGPSNPRVESSPSPVLRGEQHDCGSPGPDPEGGQGLGPLPRGLLRKEA